MGENDHDHHISLSKLNLSRSISENKSGETTESITVTNNDNNPSKHILNNNIKREISWILVRYLAYFISNYNSKCSIDLTNVIINTLFQYISDINDHLTLLYSSNRLQELKNDSKINIDHSKNINTTNIEQDIKYDFQKMIKNNDELYHCLSIGLYIDACDIQYDWYIAQIVNIHIDHQSNKKIICIQYDGFLTSNNEHIAIPNEAHRIGTIIYTY